MHRHLAKQQATESTEHPVMDISFNGLGIVLEEKDHVGRIYAAQQVTFAGNTSLPLVFGFVTANEQGSFSCHLVTCVKIPASSTFDSLRDNFAKLIAGAL